MDHLGGRKFIFGLVLTVCATVFVLIGKVTVQEWMAFEAVVGGSYIIGNIAEKVAQK